MPPRTRINAAASSPWSATSIALAGVGSVLAMVAVYLVATRSSSAPLPEPVPSPTHVAHTVPSATETHAELEPPNREHPAVIASGSNGSEAVAPDGPASSRRLLVATPALAADARTRGLEVRCENVGGESAVRIDASPGQAGLVELPLPTTVRILERQTLVIRLRVVAPTEGDALDLRLLANDAAGHTIFQRRCSIAVGAGWIEHAEPFRGWRWGDVHSGSWEEVTSFALVLPKRDTGATLALSWLDIEAGSARDLGFQLAPLMQADGPTRFIQRANLLLGSDLPDAVDEAALEVLAQRFLPVDPWLRRLFGDAVRPTQPDRPISFLVLASPQRRAAFFDALGRAWNVRISPSRAGGYTVQDIATSDWIPAKGVDRPVYVHEAVHAIAARLLRLNPGVVGHGWLQEGLANYLQLALHPSSMDPKEFAREFTLPIQETGRGWFRPLSALLSRRVEGHDYPQLASLFGYLVERQPAWLPALARGVADGKPLAAILHELGTDADALQAAWYAWGQERHAGPRPADAPHFPMPPEWAGR